MQQGIFYHLGISTLLRRLRERLEGRPDSEHEQAVLRLSLGFIASAYVVSPELSQLDGHWAGILQWTAAGFMAASAAIFAAILIWPGANPARRYFGILLDLGTTSFVLAVAGESGTPLLALYLWVTTGNGFRYGLQYLAVSAFLSLGGFGLVYWVSDFWHLHPVFAVSVVIVLVVIPAYMAALLGKLNQAVLHAKEANQAKSRFLASMSHELRTPLSGVIGMTDLLMDSPLSKDQRELARTIQTSAGALSAIIENILDFSKIEAGRVTLESTLFDLHAFFADTAQIFAHQARRKGLSFAVHIDPRLPYRLRGDPHHTRQVLINLIGNAIKFTEHGGVEVRATPLAEAEQTGDVWMRVEIEDTGIGIPLEEQGRVFESFHQAGPSTTRRFGGTGLGTSIARQLTVLMGGRIGLSSRPGEGTLFWLELPLGRPAREEAPVETQLRDLNVLVLSDAATYRELARHFGDWGLSCELAPSLEDAVKAVRSGERFRHDISVVLVACGHLAMDPVRVAAAFGDRSLIGKTSVVLLAGSFERPRETEFLDAGFSCVLYTPVDKLLLYNAVHAARASFLMPENVVSLAEHYREQAGGLEAKLHVLLAEDNEANQQVIQRILERAGHRVTAVDDGEGALDLLAASDAGFDLLLLDMNMPRRGGLEVYKASRFLDPGRRTPTIVLTAEATREAMDACNEAGVDAFLTKPVRARLLLETVARVSRDGADRAPAGSARTIACAGPEPLPASPAIPLLDEGKLEEIRELSTDPQFFAGLVRSFARDGTEAIDRLAASVASSDYPEMRGAVHGLLGSAGEMGATDLTFLCNELRKLKPLDLASDKPRHLLARIRESFSRTCAALDELSRRQHRNFPLG